MNGSKNFQSHLKWYCLKTNPNKEDFAKAYIINKLGIEVFVPKIRFKMQKSRSIMDKKEVMFPGYIFAKFDLKLSKRIISYAPGINYILTFNEKIVSLSSSTINDLKKELDNNNEMEIPLSLKIGDEVFVTNGLMNGMKVKIHTLLSKESRIGILLDLLGTSTEMFIPYEFIKQNRSGAMLA
ncbi:MAG: transcription termination/antitermination protein NusG [Pontiellaceae bacterium]